MNHCYIIAGYLLKALYHKLVLWFINDNEILADTLGSISKEALNISEWWLSWIWIRHFHVCKSIKITDAVSHVFKCLEEDSWWSYFIFIVHNLISSASLVCLNSKIFEVLALCISFKLAYWGKFYLTSSMYLLIRAHSKAFSFMGNDINIRFRLDFFELSNILIHSFLDCLASKSGWSYWLWPLKG